ncbi:hypothetical protein GDO86_007762 [Hymenochirus boettgeri]|uniref:Acyl-CoA-binding domain-containing protein 6 n=1 Tax=Hymenochirus boettgeri TaxID=247094 RepID=A0A8T2IV05_9PIPI|nr:hypothetical protein GDO86_007762 [Hymenochirus boettgeri]
MGEFLPDETTDEELQWQFEQAAKHAQNVAHVASTEQLLYLYARYKQVKVGKCNTSKPGFFDYEGKRKWEAWKALGDYSCQQAMHDYVDTIKKLDPDWSPPALEESYKEPKTTFGGPVISCLYKVQETLREEDKDMFDFCRENNISRVSHALTNGDIDVNAVDDEDSEGQTPLHYASACEFPDIVDLLLKHGADPSIVDNDGFQPHEATDSKEICAVLKQHASYREHSKPPSLLLEMPQ